VPNPADLLKQLFVDVLGAAGWTGRVLCVALPGGGVGESVDGSSAEQPADGSVGRRRPASGRGETWIAAPYGCLAKGSWKKGRRLLQVK
jgi:hypothetical protein